MLPQWSLSPSTCSFVCPWSPTSHSTQLHCVIGEALVATVRSGCSVRSRWSSRCSRAQPLPGHPPGHRSVDDEAVRRCTTVCASATVRATVVRLRCCDSADGWGLHFGQVQPACGHSSRSSSSWSHSGRESAASPIEPGVSATSSTSICNTRSRLRVIQRVLQGAVAGC